MSGLNIAVLLGSVRRDRVGTRAAKLVIRELEMRGHQVQPVDPLELQLPLLDRMYKEHPKGDAPEPLEMLAEIYRRADGFLVVSGEYNHGIPPALKNLLDHFLEEYFWRPSGIVCYSAGGFGGVRAAMQLRMTLAELGMSSVPSILPIPRISQTIGEDGVAIEPLVDRSARRFLDEFLWYANALKEARMNGTPY
ncbi:NAD(P)H-dependent oxidoreductase [Sphingomonas sp. RB56-2]|uniref:NAD(P)H-dependent oxidoreductase n=1 Tax=Sphingomonas brevis TaxID=2908206 RepID=A0ABT0SBW2_9SPHN|nr:NAD(P)H-dependent oxidoreductase [Sphingomonas brevis]MCL6741903.1 NAD(P)H-dependent oxidoreductase [Sphingomonas brevis]